MGILPTSSTMWKGEDVIIYKKNFRKTDDERLMKKKNCKLLEI